MMWLSYRYKCLCRLCNSFGLCSVVMRWCTLSLPIKLWLEMVFTKTPAKKWHLRLSGSNLRLSLRWKLLRKWVNSISVMKPFQVSWFWWGVKVIWLCPFYSMNLLLIWYKDSFWVPDMNFDKNKLGVHLVTMVIRVYIA